MATAEIIAIGTELLLGQTVDTNTSVIAKKINEIGIDIFRTSLIGDNKKRISDLINEAFTRADIVITTGGLGPTVDDPTRQAVADALDTDLDFQPHLWDQIQDRFRLFNRVPTENNKRQAYIPRGAMIIENPVGTAPAFYFLKGEKMIICLPGVPKEMDHLLNQNVIPIIQEIFSSSNINFSRIIHTAGIGESSLDELISDFETMTNPTVGLAAYPGQVDIRITAKAKNKDEALDMISPVEKKILDLLGEKVYGIDQEKMEDKLQELVKIYDIDTILYFNHLHDNIIDRITHKRIFTSIKKVIDSVIPNGIETIHDFQKPNSLLFLQTFPQPDQCLLDMTFHLNNQIYNENRSFVCQPESCDALVEFYLYNFMRESIIKEKGL